MNIILVTVDSLRADHCGWQGEATTTPNLDEHADNGGAGRHRKGTLNTVVTEMSGNT